MSLAVNAVVAGLAVFVIVAGSIWYLTVDRQRDRIQASEIRHQWSGRNGTAERIEVTVLFHNRYGVEAKLIDWHYELQVNDKRIAFAASEEPLTIRPNQEGEARLRLDVPTSFVGAWIRGHVTNDESTVARFLGEATFDVSHRNTTVTFGPRVEWRSDLRASLSEIENCPQGDSEPCVASANARWESQGESTILRLTVRVRNPTDGDMTLGTRSAELVWGTTGVGRADTSASADVPPGGSTNVEFRIFLLQELLKDWWSGHVGRCESSPTALRLVLSYTLASNEPPPTNTSSPSPSSSPSSSKPPKGSSSTSPPPTSNSSSDAAQMAPAHLVSAILALEPVLLLQPSGGDRGDVSWEFSGPILRTEFVCSKE